MVGAMSRKKDKSDLPSWFSSHSRFYYDYTTDTSYTPNYRLLTVTRQPSPDELFFYESATDTGAVSSPYIFEIFGNGVLKTKADGLYSSASSDCNVGIIHNYFDFLTIPAAPKTGDVIQQYGCGHGNVG